MNSVNLKQFQYSVPDIILIKNFSINRLTLQCLILEWRKLSHRDMKYPSQDFTLGKGGTRVQILTRQVPKTSTLTTIL